MICFLRASTIQYDVRLQKYVQACRDENIPFITLSWDRLADSNAQPEEIQFRRKTPYGRRWKNLIAHMLWQFFLLKSLISNRKKYRVIHACNIETVFPALFMKLFGKKIVFDIYDSMFIGMERKVAKTVDLLILPNRKRFSQIRLSRNDVKDFLEIENVPSLQFESHNSNFSGEHIKLAYVGVFEKERRGLEGLIQEVINNTNLELTIAGTGAGMDAMIQSAAEKESRIKYKGVVNYANALSIMANADFIMAQYFLSHPVHKYASPNKYYESLCLGTPIITTKNTLVGDMTQENDVGYAIGEEEIDLHKFFQNTHKDEFQRNYDIKAANCLKLWDKKYKQYFKEILKGSYIKKITELKNS